MAKQGATTGLNDFSFSLGPAGQTVVPGGSVADTVTTAVTAGVTADPGPDGPPPPGGVMGVFDPASVAAGAVLTLAAAADAAPAPAATSAERWQEGHEEAKHRAGEKPGACQNRQWFQRGRGSGEPQAGIRPANRTGRERR